VHVGGVTPSSGSERSDRRDAVARCLEARGGGTIAGCPMPASMPPTPPAESSSELACDSFRRVYRVGPPREDGFRPLERVAGEPPESDFAFILLRETRVNDDALPDYTGQPGYEIRDGEIDVECNSYGECMTGLYVGCTEGLGELVAPTTEIGGGMLETGVTIDGVFWFDRITSERGASVIDEVEAMDEGRVPGSATLLRMTARGRYEPDEEAAAFMAPACRAHVEAQRWADARGSCAAAAPLAGLAVDAAELYGLLGRSHEALGDTEAARNVYETSLEFHDEPAVRDRLEGLGPGP